MAKKNYDDYGYDDYNPNTGGLIRKAIMIIMIIIAILLIIYLVRGCSNRKDKVNPKPNNNPTVPINPNNNGGTNEVFDYESVLLEAGKNHYEKHQNELPTIAGECSVVELSTLLSEGLVNETKFDGCNKYATYVKVCILENGNKQFTPWLTCTNNKSNDEYEPVREGKLSDIVTDKTYVEFKFLPMKIEDASSNTLGKVEELWQEDIKYNSYKTISSTKYYRFRDKLFIWELTTKNYYTSTGIKTNANEVTEYYKTSPNSKYTLSSDKTTNAYKWYKSSSRKEYYMKNGAKYPSSTPIGEYNIKDPNGFDVTRYRTRTVTGTYSPKKYYACSTSSTSPVIKYQQKPCGQGISPEFNYQKEVFYTCAEDIELVRESPRVSSGTTCKRYSQWSALTTTACNLKNVDTCEKYTLTLYYWYKNVDDVRTYYPSGSSLASGEKVYYTSEPFKGAIKDTASKTTAYKWYNKNIQMSGTYTAVAPAGFTSSRPTNDYKWSNWSSWSTTNPMISDGRTREIESKTKIKLQEIISQASSSWKNLSQEYMTEEKLIKTFNDNGYKVNSLEDIVNNGQIKYQLKLFVRNKKESK